MSKKIQLLCLGLVLLLVAVGCGPRTPEGELEAIHELLQQERTLDALIRLENFIEDYPEEEITLTAYIMLTELYINNENYTEALAMLDEVQEMPYFREEMAPMLNQFYLQAYMGDEQYEQAMAIIQDDLEQIERDMEADDENLREMASYHYGSILIMKANVLFRMDENEEAIKVLETAKEEVEDIFDRANAGRSLGNFYLDQEEPEKAEEQFRWISDELLPGNSAAQWLHLKLAHYYEEKEKPDKAEPYYQHIEEWTQQALQNAIEEENREEIVIYKTAMADLDYQMQKYDEARAEYERLQEEYSDTEFVQQGQIQNRIHGLEQYLQFLAQQEDAE